MCILSFLGTAKHPDPDKRVIHCREDGEKKRQQIEPDEQRECNLSGVEEKDDKNDHDLEDSAAFSEKCGQKAFLSSDQIEDEGGRDDEQVPADNSYSQPERDDIRRVQGRDGQDNEGGGHQEFICSGIQKSSYFCFHIPDPGCEPVQNVREASKKKNGESFWNLPLDHQEQEDGNEEYSQDAEQVGRIKDRAFLFSLHLRNIFNLS